MMDIDPGARSMSFCLSYWNPEALKVKWLEDVTKESMDS